MSLLTDTFGNTDSGSISGQESSAAPAPGRSALRLVQRAAAQRIRLGLTGLAAIFLLVMIAAASLKPGHPVVSADSHTEPLAVLGVAPGAATNPAATNPAATNPAATNPATYENAAPPASRAPPAGAPRATHI